MFHRFNKGYLYVSLFTIVLIIYYYNIKRKVSDITGFNYNTLNSFIPIDINIYNNSSFTIDDIRIKPNEGIIFLKTHKTGSSTLNGILWRNLCLNQQMNCFIPPYDKAGKIWDFNKFADQFYVNYYDSGLYDKYPYDVWLYHFKYNDFIFKIIPNAKRIISICRNPIERFQSAWNWYNLEDKLNLSISNFIDNIYNDNKGQGKHSYDLLNKLNYRTALDATSEELVGISKYSVKFNAKFNELIYKLYNQKVILFITERFDECLLILKTMMNWNNDNNILYVIQKSSNYNRNLSSDSIKKLLELQPYDNYLYKLSNTILDKLIQSYGPDFNHDLLILKNKIITFGKYCPNYISNYDVSNFDMTLENLERYCKIIILDNNESINKAWNVKSMKNKSKVFIRNNLWNISL